MPPDIPRNPPANSPYRPLTLDIAKYRRRLDAYGLTDAQKDEYINALWMLVVNFADLNMANLFEKTCGQARAGADATPDARAPMLYSTYSKTGQEFAAAVNLPSRPTSQKEAS